MVDNPNLYSTPEGYATPEQIKSTYDYAKALLYGSQQQPVHHWTQGVSNMVNALVGGNMDYNATQREMAARDYDARNVRANVPKSNFPVNGAPPVRTSFDEAPPSGSLQNTAGGDFGLESKAIASIESPGAKNPYSLVGPYTGKMGRAIGKYQVMEANIPEWTQAALGRPMKVDEFKNSPEAQEAVFKHRFGQYEQKYGPEGAAKAWFAGEKGMKNPHAEDLFHTSVAGYADRFRKAYGGGPSGGTMAFAGQPSQPPAVQAITSAALRGEQPQPTEVADKRPAAVPGANQILPNPEQTGQQFVNPALIPQQPAYSESNLQHILASPWLPQEVKDRAYGMALQQNQPYLMQSPTGSGQILIGPGLAGQPRAQQYFAAPPHIGETTFSDIKAPNVMTFDAFGVPHLTMPGVGGGAAVGPRSEAEPAAAPAAATGAPPVPQAPGNVVAEKPPSEPAKGVQVASTNPAAGLPAEEPAPAEGPGTGTPAAPPHPLTNFAQAPLPPELEGVARIIGPDMARAYAGKKSYELSQEAAKEQNKQEIDLGTKAYTAWKESANAARNLMPNIDTALNLLNDPRTHTGMAAGLQDTWSRFKESVLGEKGANAPNELFDKLAAGTVLGTMKATLQGLGQVRLAEISLLSKANASRYYGDAANRAVLEISRRGLTKIDQLDSMAKQYVMGADVVNPITGDVVLKAGEGKRHGLDAGFDSIARDFANVANKKDEADYKDLDKLFTSGKDPAGGKLYERGEGGAPPSKPEVGQSWTFEGPDKKPVQGVWDGKGWVPQEQYKSAAPAVPVR